MTKKEEKTEKVEFNTEEMARAGLHFGHKTSKVHPKMKPYISCSRNGVHIIDLEKTKEKLQEVLEFIKELVSEKKILLLVGTKIQIRSLVEKIAKECGFPYVSERWLGGTFTNFNAFLKRIDYYKNLGGQKETGEWEKYTKKERANLLEELKDLGAKFEGIKNLQKLPDAIFVCDMKTDKLAVHEAKMRGVKIIGISDTNIDPSQADLFIPANDDAISSVSYILEKIKGVCQLTK